VFILSVVFCHVLMLSCCRNFVLGIGLTNLVLFASLPVTLRTLSTGTTKLAIFSKPFHPSRASPSLCLRFSTCWRCAN